MFIRIFIYFNMSEATAALSDIASLIDCAITDNGYLAKKGYLISIEKNDEFDIVRSQDFPDGFLYFPFSLEIDVDDNIDLKSIIYDLNNILNHLWKNEYPAVAACSFEDKLLNNGGYKSDVVPWI